MFRTSIGRVTPLITVIQRDICVHLVAEVRIVGSQGTTERGWRQASRCPEMSAPPMFIQRIFIHPQKLALFPSAVTHASAQPSARPRTPAPSAARRRSAASARDRDGPGGAHRPLASPSPLRAVGEAGCAARRIRVHASARGPPPRQSPHACAYAQAAGGDGAEAGGAGGSRTARP